MGRNSSTMLQVKVDSCLPLRLHRNVLLLSLFVMGAGALAPIPSFQDPPAAMYARGSTTYSAAKVSGLKLRATWREGGALAFGWASLVCLFEDRHMHVCRRPSTRGPLLLGTRRVPMKGGRTGGVLRRLARLGAVGGEDEEDWLDVFGADNEEVFLIRDPADWIEGLQPKRLGGPRPMDVEYFSSTKARKRAEKEREKGWGGQGGAQGAMQTALDRLREFGFGFTRKRLDGLIDKPNLPISGAELLLIGIISVLMFTLLKGIGFLIWFLVRFSLSLFLIIGISFFCITIIWLITEI